MAIKKLIRDWLSPHPTLFIPIYRALAPETHQKLLIAPDTQIVIEGYARSANTFSVVAFQEAQPEEVKIAHHLHVEGQILEGVRRGLPVIALIRRPTDAIRSLKVAFPDDDENRLLRRYVNFYRAVERVRDDVVIAEFSRVTSDFGSIIAEVNAKFGTDFALFATSDDSVEGVFSSIDTINKDRKGDKDLIARPAAHKEKAKTSVTLDFDPKLLAEADRLFNSLTASS
ncbi:MAG: hypothetical protein H6918_01105 [Sphingomonadaceae bacterium]|nr:hypothetical protein [Sphingomonadaceae bacterium]